MTGLLALDFLAPTRLWWLVLPVAVAVAYLVAQIRRRGVVARFTNLDLLDEVAPDRPRARRHIPAVLATAALVVLVLAAARPAVAEEVPQEGAVVMLAIDTSLSMAAEDVQPDRLSAATAAAESFLDEVPEGVEVGLVAFDGSARVVIAPDDRPEAVRTALGGISLGEGTAVGDAIVAAVGAIDANRDTTEAEVDADPDEPAAVIVLLSDGETTQGEPNENAAALAADMGIPVNTVAFGTDGGEVVVEGDTIPVPVNEEALAAVAEATDGQFFPAETAAELESIYTMLGREVTHTTTEREVTDLLSLAALVILAAAVGTSLLWAGRVP